MHQTPITDAKCFYAVEDRNRTEYVSCVSATLARHFERENSSLRLALKQARAWGVNSEGFSAEQSRKLSDWIDAGMVGAPPPIPYYYPPSAALANVAISQPDAKPTNT